MQLMVHQTWMNDEQIWNTLKYKNSMCMWSHHVHGPVLPLATPNAGYTMRSMRCVSNLSSDMIHMTCSINVLSQFICTYIYICSIMLYYLLLFYSFSYNLASLYLIILYFSNFIASHNLIALLYYIVSHHLTLFLFHDLMYVSLYIVHTA